MLADGKRFPVSKFYFMETEVLDKGEVDQNRPMAEGEVPFRQDGHEIGKFCRGFDRPAGELEP